MLKVMARNNKVSPANIRKIVNNRTVATLLMSFGPIMKFMKKYCDTSKLSVRKISKSVAKDIIVKNHYSHLWTKVSHSFRIIYRR